MDKNVLIILCVYLTQVDQNSRVFMWTSLRIYIYKIVDFINGLSGLLYRTGWTSVNGILKYKLFVRNLFDTEIQRILVKKNQGQSKWLL